MYLLDTDILIDYLRLYPSAIEFLDEISKKERHISVFTQFELLKGCATKAQEARVDRFLHQFTILHITSPIEKLALSIFRIKRWSFGLGLADSFIAATAIIHHYSLVTRNTKHYQNIENLKISTPYS